MRKGQVLTYAELHRECAAAVATCGKSQRAIALALGVSDGALSNAVNNAGARYARLQARVLQYLDERYNLVEVGGWEVQRTD